MRFSRTLAMCTLSGLWVCKPRCAEKRKRSESENGQGDSAGDPMSQTRRPNVPTFEYLYARRPLANINLPARKVPNRVCLLLVMVRTSWFHACTHTRNAVMLGDNKNQREYHCHFN